MSPTYSPQQLKGKVTPITGSSQSVYLAQAADFGPDTSKNDGQIYHLNQKFLDAIAKQFAMDYINGVLYSETPDSKTYSGIPYAIVSEAQYSVPGARWSALHIYDYGQGLKTTVHRYPRRPLPGQELIGPIGSLSSSGSGSGYYPSTRMGSTQEEKGWPP